MKKTILGNFKYVILSYRNAVYRYVKDDKELKTILENCEIKENDFVITLDEKQTKVAEKISEIKLK